MAGTNPTDAVAPKDIPQQGHDVQAQAAGAALSQEAFKPQSAAGADKSQAAAAPRFAVEGSRAMMLSSEYSQPGGKFVSEADPKKDIDVSLYVKSKASEADMQQTLAAIAAGKQADYSNNPQGFADKFGADPASMKQVEQFAKQNGLTIKSEDAVSGQVVLSGDATQVGNAFDTKMANFKAADGSTYMGHEGNISLPASMASDVTAVLGLDKRSLAKPHFVRLQDVHQGVAGANAESFKGYMPNDVAKMYDFPMAKGGAGQGVGIVELGGGLDLKDNAKYYAEHKLPEPKINIIGVDGATSTPTTPDSADGEVALDSQVVGAVAPKATQNLIFSSSDDQGFVDGVTRATFQPAGEAPNAAISVSWGKPEAGWTKDAADTMRQAIQKAALKGINTYVASGDQGANDRAPQGTFSVDLPSSVPESIGVGGTNIAVSHDKITKETVWNNGPDMTGESQASGGGISEMNDIPDYQKGIKMPPNANGDNHVGRGVPDIAGDADPESGYAVRVDGQDTVIGGTSASAPLYAALNALTNKELGHSTGWLNPKLYNYATTNPKVFNDVTVGNNDGYNAGPGWDATTGMGSINGAELLKALKNDKT